MHTAERERERERVSEQERERERERKLSRREEVDMSEDVVFLSLQNIAQAYFEHDLNKSTQKCVCCLPLAARSHSAGEREDCAPDPAGF